MKDVKKAISYRNDIITSTIPHRRKYKGNRTAPEFALYYNDKGKARKFKYVDSRVFYCVFLSQQLVKRKAFAKLKRILNVGYNVEIFSYDNKVEELSVPSGKTCDKSKIMMREFKRSDRSFGHGKLLYCLLMLPRDDWPWIKYARANIKLYQDFKCLTDITR